MEYGSVTIWPIIPANEEFALMISKNNFTTEKYIEVKLEDIEDILFKAMYLNKAAEKNVFPGAGKEEEE